MNSFTKTLVVTTLPAVVCGTRPAGAQTAAAPQSSTQPATQPAPILAQSNAPLVIPDGTSPQNPGPVFRQPGWQNNNMMDISGLRQ